VIRISGPNRKKKMWVWNAAYFFGFRKMEREELILFDAAYGM
jgi:hypothetical protein